MKFRVLVNLFFILCINSISDSDILAQTLAFPGAEGYGKYTEGGRGGIVVEVTNLNDAGPGSLRHALLYYSQPRTIVFRVGGIIELNSTIEMNGDSYVTIAGQTAPGGGICLKNYPLMITDSEHIIVRYIRSRLGDQGDSDEDAMSIRGSNNIILDHCSMSWSIDAILDVTHQSGNITVQWCILSEALHNSHHEKGAHGYAAGWDGKNGSTYHHNLIASCESRTPRLDKFAADDGTRDDLIDIINNVMYNWDGYGAYGGEKADVNWQNNFYRYGPETGFAVRNQIFKPDGDCMVYVDGNYVAGYPEVTEDNSLGINNSKPLDQVLVDAPFTTMQIDMESAKAAFESVLANAGAVLPVRDSVDMRIVNDVQNGTGQIIDSQDEVGGWPTYASGAAPTDTDSDGMPDEWEDTNGLDKNDASDRNITNEEGYTSLEIYLNSLIKDFNYLAKPIHLQLDSLTDKQVHLSWEDVSAKETGYILERKSDGSWEQIANLPSESVEYTDESITDLGNYYYRMKTIGEDSETDYTDSIHVVVEEITSVEKIPNIQKDIVQVLPNPFNTEASINLYVQKPSNVRIIISDITGKVITQLANNFFTAGKHQFQLNGSVLMPGIYLVKVNIDGENLLPVKIVKR